MTDRFIEWCARDTTSARLQRTIVQGVIGVAIGWLTAWAAQDAMIGTYVAPVAMCVLSPIMAAIGNRGETKVGGSE